MVSPELSGASLGSGAMVRGRSKDRPATRPGHDVQRRSEAIWGFVFAAPAVLGFLLLKLLPILYSLYVAMTQWSGVGTATWVGLDNFTTIFFRDPLFWKSLQVTFYYTFLAVPASMAFALFLASLLNANIPGQGVFRTLFYIPSIVPIIATSVIWLWMFNPDFGLFNAALKPLGLPKLQYVFSASQAIPSLVFMSLWSVGPMMIIFLAGLQDIPKDLYEAAQIDGAPAWRQLVHITLPMLTPTILFNLMISMVAALQTFVQPYIMTNGGPNNATNFFVFRIYQKAFQNSQMGYACALAWVLFVIICALSYAIFHTSRRWVYYRGGND
jgi:multiple sugar transport system permease protein